LAEINLKLFRLD